MNINLKFAIWCTQKCLHLWNPPKKILVWMDDPENYEYSEKARSVALTTKTVTHEGAASAAVAALATEAIYWREISRKASWRTVKLNMLAKVWEMDAIKCATERASIALDVSISELKHQFVSTWTDEELKTDNPDWIEYVTVEIFSR